MNSAAANPGTIDYEHVRAVRARKAAMYEADPTSALVAKTVVVRPLDSFRKSGEVRGFEIFSDEPTHSGGSDAAPQPTEYMLASLGFCQLSMLIACAAAMRLDVTSFVTRVTGFRDNRGNAGTADVRAGYYRIEVETTVESSEPSDRLRRLVELAEARCPVYDNLAHPTRLETRVLRADEVVFEGASENH